MSLISRLTPVLAVEATVNMTRSTTTGSSGKTVHIAWQRVSFLIVPILVRLILLLAKLELVCPLTNPR